MYGLNNSSFAGPGPGAGGFGVYGLSARGHGLVGATATTGGAAVVARPTAWPAHSPRPFMVPSSSPATSPLSAARRAPPFRIPTDRTGGSIAWRAPRAVRGFWQGASRLLRPRRNHHRRRFRRSLRLVRLPLLLDALRHHGRCSSRSRVRLVRRPGDGGSPVARGRSSSGSFSWRVVAKPEAHRGFALRIGHGSPGTKVPGSSDASLTWRRPASAIQFPDVQPLPRVLLACFWRLSSVLCSWLRSPPSSRARSVRGRRRRRRTSSTRGPGAIRTSR